MRYIDKIMAERAERQVQADAINVSATYRTTAELRTAIIALADKLHEQYPQYADHWTGPEWQVARATRTETTKGGTVMRKGDFVIARAKTERERREYILNTLDRADRPARQFVTVFSLLNNLDTSVEAHSVAFTQV